MWLLGTESKFSGEKLTLSTAEPSAASRIGIYNVVGYYNSLANWK